MKAITFKLPEGVQIPDGKQAGDTFQAMTTYQIGTGGNVTLTEIDGEPIDGKDTDDLGEPNESANDDTTQPGPNPGGMGGLRGALMGGS